MVAKKTVHEKVIREVIEKSSKKKNSNKRKKKNSSKSIKKSASDLRIEKVLIDNFISLQKVMVGFSSKFEDLSNQISKLLNLFETSAKTLAEKEYVAEQDKKDNKDIIKKMEDIIEQNKTIARGITLMHDLVTGEEETQLSTNSMPTPVMRTRMPSQTPQLPISKKPLASSDLYQRSIYSKENESGNSK